MAPRFQPRRTIGRTGFVATAIGQGDLADRSLPLERCAALLRRALDAGVNVVDTAPSYEEGYSEEIVGAALRGRRQGVFVVDKVDHLDRPVGPQLTASLERLGLPAVDLAVLHSVSTLDAWMRAAAPGGAVEQLGEEVARGRARFRGISSHDPDVLLAALETGSCDAVMFPVGPFVDLRYLTQVLPRARARGVGTICFKAFGAGKLLGDTEGYGRALAARPRGKLSSGGVDLAAPTLPRLDVVTCVRYALTCDPDVVLLGLSFENEQDAAWAAAEAFRPMSAGELAEARRAAAGAVVGKGAIWWNPGQG